MSILSGEDQAVPGVTSWPMGVGGSVSGTLIQAEKTRSKVRNQRKRWALPLLRVAPMMTVKYPG